jgi:hypothetical protein
LAQPLAQAPPVLGTRGEQLELLPVRRRQRDELEPQLDNRRRQLGELRRKRRAEPRRVGGRLAERHRPAPRGAADEPRPERDLPRRPPGAFRSGKELFEQHCKPSP